MPNRTLSDSELRAFRKIFERVETMLTKASKGDNDCCLR